MENAVADQQIVLPSPSSASFHTLPTEIFQEILIFAVYQTDHAKRPLYVAPDYLPHFPYTALYVSHLWKEIALSTLDMWARIALVGDASEDKIYAKIQQHLILSTTRPFDLVILTRNECFRFGLKFPVQHHFLYPGSRQVRTRRMQTCPDIISGHFWPGDLFACGPAVTRLSFHHLVELEVVGELDPPPDEPSFIPTFLKVHLPKLRRLVLTSKRWELAGYPGLTCIPRLQELIIRAHNTEATREWMVGIDRSALRVEELAIGCPDDVHTDLASWPPAEKTLPNVRREAFLWRRRSLPESPAQSEAAGCALRRPRQLPRILRRLHQVSEVD